MQNFAFNGITTLNIWLVGPRILILVAEILASSKMCMLVHLEILMIIMFVKLNLYDIYLKHLEKHIILKRNPSRDIKKIRFSLYQEYGLDLSQNVVISFARPFTEVKICRFAYYVWRNVNQKVKLEI